MYISLNEVYFGKTKNLLEAEKLLTDIKKDYDGQYYRAAKVVGDKRWARIQELFATEFGCKRFILSIESVAVENAFTYPISWGIDVAPTCRTRSNLICDPKGFKFKQEAGYILSVTIYSGLLLNPLLTAGELMGILIHEVGHNFQAVIDDRCFMLTDITHVAVLINNIIAYAMKGNISGVIGTALTPITAANFYKGIVATVNDTLMKYELVQIVYYLGSTITGICESFKYGFLQLLGSVLGYTYLINPAFIVKEVVRGLMGLILNPLGYRGERIADNFATAYGYGPELSSALMKMEMDAGRNLPIYGTIQSIPFVGQFVRGGMGIAMMVGSLFDAHPNNMERCLDQVRYLKQELPLMSKEDRILVNKQIDTIESNLEGIMKDPKLDDHWDAFRYIACAAVYNDGGDIKGRILGRDVHDSIQKTYDSKRGYKEPRDVKFTKPKLI